MHSIIRKLSPRLIPLLLLLLILPSMTVLLPSMTVSASPNNPPQITFLTPNSMDKGIDHPLDLGVKRSMSVTLQLSLLDEIAAQLHQQAGASLPAVFELFDNLQFTAYLKSLGSDTAKWLSIKRQP